MESPIPEVIGSVIRVLKAHKEAKHRIRALEEEVARLKGEIEKSDSPKEWSP
jgi:uncharacterized small protein (DUF1192 family)